jgi:hypothetical protein
VACGLLTVAIPACYAEVKKEDYDMTHQSVPSTDKKDGWSVGRVLASGDKSIIASLQADFIQKPGMYTAQFSLAPIDLTPPPPIFPNPPNTFAPIKAEAEITWAVEGNTIVRKISVSNGVTISGPGQAVHIVIKDASVISPSLPPHTVLGQKYFVAVTLTPGVRPSDTLPPVLFQANAVLGIPAGGAALIDIPQNVGVKSVLVTVADVAGNSILEQHAQTGQLGPAGNTMTLYDPRAFGFFPVLPGAVGIELLNKSGVTLVFSVLFGVDG